MQAFDVSDIRTVRAVLHAAGAAPLPSAYIQPGYGLADDLFLFLGPSGSTYAIPVKQLQGVSQVQAAAVVRALLSSRAEAQCKVKASA